VHFKTAKTTSSVPAEIYGSGSGDKWEFVPPSGGLNPHFTPWLRQRIQTKTYARSAAPWHIDCLCDR